MVLISQELKRNIMAAVNDEKIMKKSNAYGKRLSTDYPTILKNLDIDSNTKNITKEHIVKLLDILENSPSARSSKSSKSKRRLSKSKRRSRKSKRRRTKMGGGEEVVSMIMMLPFFLMALCVLGYKRDREDSDREYADSDSDSD